MTEAARFRPDRILETLARHQVRFVLIGGLAAQVHGSPSLTRDLDICYDRGPGNLARLAAVLAELVAVRRGLPVDSPRLPPLDARTLRAGGLFTLSTAAGDFDLLADPDPGFDFERLRSTAIEATFAGHRVAVASLDDLMEMKRAAGRPKDLIELEVLGALRAEIERQDA